MYNKKFSLKSSPGYSCSMLEQSNLQTEENTTWYLKNVLNNQ